MVHLTVEERVFIVSKYFETHSFVEVRNLFRERFPDKEPPVKKTIWRKVKKYKENWTSLNLDFKECGRSC